VTVCILVKNLGQDDLKIETEENKVRWSQTKSINLNEKF
jgi:hypothetical protein